MAMHTINYANYSLIFKISMPSFCSKLYNCFELNLEDNCIYNSIFVHFESQIKFSEFVARHIGEKEGIILEAETGDFLGKHRGFWFYTIGQRQGLRLPGGPWYVPSLFLSCIRCIYLMNFLSHFIYSIFMQRYMYIVVKDLLLLVSRLLSQLIRLDQIEEIDKSCRLYKQE